VKNVDLHCHSNRSDGVLAPAALVRRAAAHGVDLLALTDHDQLAGLAEASQAARETGIGFVPGVEVSVTWRGTTVHIIGLGIDPDDARLAAGLARVRSGRTRRARSIARSLEDAGIRGALDGALRHVGDAAMISRTHFARYLVDIRAVTDLRDAFRRFLGPGKPGYVAQQWATLGDAIGWICGAGGQAVIAHPGRYALSAGAQRALLGEFRDAGGTGLEVVTSSHAPDAYRVFGALAQAFGLRASRGSDFHAPGEGVEFGALPTVELPVPALWDGWSA
jgi:3',5'-nucleoside bisphosphate phosphatase